MEAQRNELIELAEKNGWKCTGLDNYDFYKWSMETWLLESVWSPIGATAYVSFLIDPQSDFQNPYPWAIEVSNEKPVYGKFRDYLLISLIQWKNEKHIFLKYLSEIRNQSKNRAEKAK